MEEFKFEGLGEGGFVEPELSNTEREMLRALATPGAPLWKIVKGLLDYRGVLIENLAMLDLGDVDQLAKARSLSAEAKAVQWQHQMWERLLAPLPNQQENKA